MYNFDHNLDSYHYYSIPFTQFKEAVIMNFTLINYQL